MIGVSLTSQASLCTGLRASGKTSPAPDCNVIVPKLAAQELYWVCLHLMVLASD